ALLLRRRHSRDAAAEVAPPISPLARCGAQPISGLLCAQPAAMQTRFRIHSTRRLPAPICHSFRSYCLHVSNELHAPLDLRSAMRHPLKHVAEEMIESVRLGHAL